MKNMMVTVCKVKGLMHTAQHGGYSDLDSWRMVSNINKWHIRICQVPGIVLGNVGIQCNNVSKFRMQGLHQHNCRVRSSTYGDHQMDHNDTQKTYSSDEVTRLLDIIKRMLCTMDDGDVTVSAYDTAWVALIHNINGSRHPQFPSCLEWIVNNQLSDGSWGDSLMFLAHDRVLNTLACIIALTSWNIHPAKCQQGLMFLKENISKLEEVEGAHLPIGFEVTFPSLLNMARKLKLDVPEDTPAVKEIYARRRVKLTKIPKEVLHNVPTALLHSLEGLPDLDWGKLLKMQCKEGSFLFSPSATAFAYMQIEDEKCLQYLTNLVTKFNGGVPGVYPVDLFEHIWVVDRLQRLGISRYFEPEIKACAEYIHRYWTKDGICWARNSNVQDIDDTIMGFRVLRMHGYEVTPDVLKQFEKDGKFVCFKGQSTQAVTGMFNLYRTSQMLFPGEKILEDAKKFSYNFLKEKQSANKILDKWIIAKDLPGEVGYALNVPWYASLPRLETRYYLDQYGGEDEAWIAKGLYRMGNVSNNTYLEMAKLDYNNCQAMHQHEWNALQLWYLDSGIKQFANSDDLTSLLIMFYLAAASIFEPERSMERLSWAKTSILVDTITKFFDSQNLTRENKQDFVDQFKNNNPNPIKHSRSGEPWYDVMVALQGTLHDFALEALMAHNQDIYQQLHHAWEMWLMRWQDGEDVAVQAELIIQTINITAGRWVSVDLLTHPQYKRLSTASNYICHELLKFHNSKENFTTCCDNGTSMEIDSKMQELVQLVLSNNDLDCALAQTILTVVRTFYYMGYFDQEAINVHISETLFEIVI